MPCCHVYHIFHSDDDRSEKMDKKERIYDKDTDTNDNDEVDEEDKNALHVLSNGSSFEI